MDTSPKEQVLVKFSTSMIYSLTYTVHFTIITYLRHITMHINIMYVEMSTALMVALQGFAEEDVELVDLRECVVEWNWDHSHHIRLTIVHLKGDMRRRNEVDEAVKWQCLPEHLS